MQARTFIPSKNCPSSSMGLNVIDPNDKLGTQRISHLDIPKNYQYLTSFTILMPTDRFSNIPMLMVTIDTMHTHV